MKCFLFVTLLLNFFIGPLYNMNSHNLRKNNFLDEESYILKYLPKDAVLLNIGSNKYITAELDGSGNKEIIAAYKEDISKNAVFLMVIIYTDTNSEEFRLKGDGEELDFVKIVDITGDGKDDILLGTKIGENTNRLSLFSYKDNKCTKEFSYSYNKFEILEMNKGVSLKNRALAFWNITREDFYKVEVVRWSGREFLDATDIQKEYYKKVVQYYINLAAEKNNNPYYWYYLAEAQIKAGEKKEALISIAKGISLNKDYPTKQEFEQLKQKIR